jgi:hypothetical protein
MKVKSNKKIVIFNAAVPSTDEIIVILIKKNRTFSKNLLSFFTFSKM